MPTVSELIQAGYGGYQGWNDAAANADFNATGGSGKYTGGGSMGGPSIPAFNVDEKAAEQKAMAELAPYYEQVLKMYGGDVALAKQRIDQDYERGLRIQTSNADWAKDDIDIASQERKRKLNLAVKDLDQQLNARGIYDSGIKTQEQGNLQAGEAYQAGQDTRNKEEIARELSQFSEGKIRLRQTSCTNSIRTICPKHGRTDFPNSSS